MSRASAMSMSCVQLTWRRGRGDLATRSSRWRHWGIYYADLYFRKGSFPGLPRPPFVLGLEGVGTMI